MQFLCATGICLHTHLPARHMLQSKTDVQTHHGPSCQPSLQKSWEDSEGVLGATTQQGPPAPRGSVLCPVPLLQILTALVSYSTSFCTELMMGAAAVGMAPAKGGPTTGQQAAPQVVTACEVLPETERRLRRPPPSTPDSADKNNVGTLNNSAARSHRLLPDSLSPASHKPRPD